MNLTTWLKTNYLFIPLALLMALTRVHHFGDAFSLPDASLAVFFLAGLKFKRLELFALLLVEAAAIDYVAIAHFSVSDYCISPAYLFLVPTYAAMWYAGRYCAQFQAWNSAEFAKSLGMAALASTAAFAISNGSFYLFSGRFGDLSFAGYLARTANFYPAYASAALIYALIGLAAFKLIAVMPALLNKHTAV